MRKSVSTLRVLIRARQNQVSIVKTVQQRAAGEPAWAAEARKRYEEEQRRREARKKQVESTEDLLQDNNTFDLGDHVPSNPSTELPVVEEDGWLLFQSHNSFPADKPEAWDPTTDNEVAGATLRSVEEAKFHCKEMGYGGFIRKWSLIYYFKNHPPKKLVAGREHCQKEERGMLDLYVSPDYNGEPTLDGEIKQQYDDAVARGETPQKKDMSLMEDDLDDLDESFKDELKDEKVNSALDDDWNPNTLKDSFEKFADNLKDLPQEPIPVDSTPQPTKVEPITQDKKPNSTKSEADLLSDFASLSVPERNKGRNVARRPTRHVKPAVSEPKPAQPAVPKVFSSAEEVKANIAVTSNRDITVKGQLRITKGTEGIVVGPATSGHPEKFHVTFERAEGGGNPNLNVNFHDLIPL